MRIRIQEGKNDPKKESLGVLYGGLGIRIAIFDQRNRVRYIKKFPPVNFFQFLVIKALDLELDPDPHWDLDPDPQLEKMLDPDPYADPH
jgi:hypothetical protein